MQQNNKYWCKNDEILLSDINGKQPPIDPFKSIYFAQSKKNGVCEKALTKNYINPGSLPKKKFQKTTARWTENEIKFKMSGRNSNISEAPKLPTDYDPLFSSFNKDKVFIPPKSSKDTLSKQKISENRKSLKLPDSSTLDAHCKKEQSQDISSAKPSIMEEIPIVGLP